MAPPLTEQQEKLLNKIYYTNKNFFGRDKLYNLLKEYDISRRQVAEWLNKQEVHQLYAPAKKPKTIQNTILNEPYTQIGIDLMDMQNIERNGKKYVLTAIDLFSKKAWAIPLKDKSDETVEKGMEDILYKIGHKIRSVRSDNGSEFISEEFKDLMEERDITHIFSIAHKPQSNGNIERFNGILKRLINMAMKVNENFNWVNQLDKLINNYNNTKQETIEAVPNEVEGSNYADIKQNITKHVLGKKQAENIRFRKGDKVRIRIADERNNSTYSKDIYTVERVFVPRNHITTPYYFLAEEKGKGSKYYNNELLKVDEVEHETKKIEYSRISHIIKPLIVNGEKYFQIQWVGEGTLTSEPRDKLLKDVPKMIHRYEKEHEVKWMKRGHPVYI